MILHAFHGGIQDGLELANLILHPQVILPAEGVINNGKDYDAWVPTEGHTVAVYLYRGPPTKDTDTGIWRHHLYLDRTEMLYRKEL